MKDAIITWKYAVALWKIDKSEADRKAEREAVEAEQEEKDRLKRLKRLERDGVDRLREQQQRAA